MTDLIKNFDPVVAESVSDYHLSMRLHLNLGNGLRFIRDYYDVEMSNGDLLIYMTTNELNAEFEELHYNEDFSFYFSHQHAIEDMKINETLNVYENRILESVKSINSIIYYQPETISNDFKQAIQNELIESIDAYTELDFNKKEKELLKAWKTYLK